uniref:Uncharacterized protein n=1 Tax=Rhizophora mucronata TaxID=61149 RepID=A0A2P2KGR4_RHIMU
MEVHNSLRQLVQLMWLFGRKNTEAWSSPCYQQIQCPKISQSLAFLMA